MSYTFTKDKAISIKGFDQGIAASPHKGIAHIKNANIYTETGEIMASFGRIQENQVSISGTLTQVASDAVSVSVSGGNGFLLTGTWITVTNTTISGLANGVYYVLDGNPNVVGYNLSTTYSTNTASRVTGLGSGTANFTTSGYDLGKPIDSCSESYTDINGVAQFRYYILDANGYVWVNDTSTAQYTNISFPPVWFLPNTFPSSSYGNSGGNGSAIPSGIAVLNGWLFVFVGNGIFCKSTSRLDETFIPFSGGTSTGLPGNSNIHSAFVGHQGQLYYTDGVYLGSIFPSTSLLTGATNVQSYCRWNAPTGGSNAIGTITNLINGSLPTTVTVGTSPRIPVYFFSEYLNNTGSTPTAITKGSEYFIQVIFDANGNPTFKVWTAITGGSQITDLVTGAVGKQYFNTFYPTSGLGAGMDTITFSQQRLILPSFEIAQSIAEIGNTILVGGKTNTLYPWNQIDPLPGDIILLPESNVVDMITVNNMAYIFAGNKGNIYISNGSTASPAISVPDYCAGIPGSVQTYVEPYFTWGDSMYLRGRVYFSILDQTATKAGNCGGIWSFTPSNNVFLQQDTGLALRIENKNSYGTYNGVANVLLPVQNQLAKSPQYWSAWQSTLTSPLYGIDFTDTVPSQSVIIETDLIPTGTMLDKESFERIEYKLATPLVGGDSVSMSYRTNGTDAYTSLGGAILENNPLSGYFVVNFEKTQWLQLQITLSPQTTTTSSFVRLLEVTIY